MIMASLMRAWVDGPEVLFLTVLGLLGAATVLMVAV